MQAARPPAAGAGALWSRHLRRLRWAYVRHFVRNDEAYHGGPFDRTRYVRSREMPGLAAERVWENTRGGTKL